MTARLPHVQLRWINRVRPIVSAKAGNLWTLLLILLAAALLYRTHVELGQTLRALRSARLRWLLLLSALAILLQGLMAFKVRQILNILGHAVPLPVIASGLLRRNVVSTAIPFGSAPGSVAFARRMRDYDVPFESTVLAFVVYSALGHTSFVLVMIPVLLWLAASSSLPTAVVLGGAALAVVAVVFIALVATFLAGKPVPGRISARLPGSVRSRLSTLEEIQVSPRRLGPPLATALLVDLTGIALVWTALLAVHGGSDFRLACAGYVVGSIFLLIAPIFQGIGLVEVSMAVTLERLGLSAPMAVGTTMLYRVADIWAPLTVGVGLQIRAQEALRRVPRNLPALLTGLTGLLSVLSVLAPTIPRRFNRLEDYAFLSFNDVSRTFSLLAGSLLIGLSLALWRRRYVAWWSAVIMLSLLTLSHIFKRHDQIVTIFGGVNLALLLITHSRFRVRSDFPTIRRGVALFVGCLIFAVAYGSLGFWLLDRREFGIEFTVGRSLQETLRLFFNLGSTNLQPHTRYAEWFLDSVSLVGIVATIGAFVSLLRPVVWRSRTLPHEREEARVLVTEYGRSSLDEFKTWPDKLFFFSADRRSVISFGVSNGVAVVLGDPTAPDVQSSRAIIESFLDFCNANAWHVAFHQVPPRLLPLYADLGLGYLKLGEEAIVDLATWSLAGNAMKGFRSAINRLERLGYRTAIHQPPQSDSMLDQLRAVSDAWLTLPGRRERAFTLGRWADDYIRRCPVFTLESSTGEIVAFMNVIDDGVPGEATMDLMRHMPDAPNGAMDVLFAGLADYFRSIGKTSFSLGMVPFYDVGSHPDDPLIERGIRLLIGRMERFFSYRGLSAYKDKFHPHWEPRYVIYSSAIALPQIALAIVRLTEGNE